MKNTLFALISLAIALFGALLIGTSLNTAQAGQPVADARPTPTPEGMTVSLPQLSPDSPTKPDLIVESIRILPPAPVISEPVIIEVTIKNQGGIDVDTTNNFWTDLYVDPATLPIQLGQDGIFAWGCQGWWMSAGDSYTLRTAYVFTDVKTYALYAQVDTDQDVIESNENNNVLGPVEVAVRTRNEMTWQTHQDFQLGLASGLDLSHPDGVMRFGLFDEPPDAPGIYEPDLMINDITGTTTTRASQIRPALTGDGIGMLYAVWEDNRNGYFNRDIYFSRLGSGWTAWLSDVQVYDDDAQQASPDVAFDAVHNRVIVVWQDNRDGRAAGNESDYDIWAAYSTDDGDTWTGHTKISDDTSGASQINPTIVAGPSGNVYVVWQDQRNNNDDVYLARSPDGGDTWLENVFVTDDPHMTLQNQVAPSVDVVEGLGGEDSLYVCWEDWRDPDHPEIYVARSSNYGQSFGVDIPVSYPAGTSYRRAPSLAVSTVYSGTGSSALYLETVHVGWQEGGDEDADVYWAYATYPPDDQNQCPSWAYEFCFEEMKKINGFVIDSEYVRPPNSGPSWPIEPSWQGDVSLTQASENDITWCHADSDELYSAGAFLAWSDGASYDDWHYDLSVRRVACYIEPTINGIDVICEPCEDTGTGVVNNNVKLYAFRNDLNLYQVYKPASARLSNPSIYAEAPPAPSFIPSLHLAWDDDRWDRPDRPGTVRNRDVFFTENGYAYDQGVFISNPIDSHLGAKWFTISWWGATAQTGDIQLQTRFGDTPWPPLEDVEADGWTRWTGNPSVPTTGCPGEGCYYDAPGRHIVGPDGTQWPESRYIQYKVIIKGSSAGWRRVTALSQVTIYYEGAFLYYLPLVAKGYY